MKPSILRQFQPAHRRLPIPQCTLYQGLQVSARRYPERHAVHYYGQSITYAELKRDVDALAGYLQHSCGVVKGERVLLYMQNCPQWIVAYYAILRADAVVVPVNPMNLTDELVHYVRDAQARVAMVGSELIDRIQPLLGAQGLQHIVSAHYADCLREAPSTAVPDVLRTPAPQELPAGVIDWQAALAAQQVPGPHLAQPDDMAVMPYTSGTTGNPKGCIHTHHTLMAIVGGAAMLHMITQADVVLSVAPFFHITGMQAGMNAGLYNGGSLVVMTRWDREAALDLIAAHQVSVWIAIPTMVVDLLACPRLQPDSLQSLLHITGGGIAMPEAVARQLHEMTGLSFIEVYGMTETAAPTHANPHNKPKRQCLGVPIFNTDSRIVHQETLQEVGVHEVGEIVTHGPQVFKGYWNCPEATAASFIEIDGKRFFRTGDLARRDADGYFFMVDRLKRMINASGYKVWPAEVEALLYGHPDIHEACVIAAKDPKRGETVKAYVVLRPGSQGQVSEADILNWSKQHMATYKAPRIIEFTDSLPKSGTGKIQWRELQEREDAKERGGR